MDKNHRLDGFPLHFGGGSRGGRREENILAEFHRIKHKNHSFLRKLNECRAAKLQGCTKSHYEF